MTEKTPSSLAIEKITEQIAALDVAIDALVALRGAKAIDHDFANWRIDRLASRQLDLGQVRKTILLTGQVSSVPTPEQVTDLRARVTALRNMNVTAAGIENIFKEAVLIAGVVLESPSERSVAPEATAAAKLSEAVPLTLAFGVGTAAGLIIAALMRSRD